MLSASLNNKYVYSKSRASYNRVVAYSLCARYVDGRFDSPVLEPTWRAVELISTPVWERDGKSVRSCCDGSSDRSFMEDPLSYFSFQPVLHDWCNKGCGMCYLVCRMVYIKDPLLLIEKISPCSGGSYLNGPLPYYVRRHITENKMCWVRR